MQYSSLLTPQQRASLLATNVTSASLRSQLSAIPTVSSSSPTFGLSEFPRLLSGELRLNVPVYTVWGACEDVHVLEKMRVAPPAPISVPRDTATQRSASSFAPANHNPAIDYSIPNLTVIDEATSRCLVIGGVRLRLFGLGGAVVPHKFFDNGSGQATIAGGQGTMWTTMLQIGELVDTATKAYDAAETRVLVSHASPGREGLVSQLALALKADLTISAGLHFRYGISYNEFSTQYDAQGFTGKLEQSKKVFNDVWQSVKAQVDSDIECVPVPLLWTPCADGRVTVRASAPCSTTHWQWRTACRPRAHSTRAQARLQTRAPGRTCGTGTCPTLRLARSLSTSRRA